MLAMAVTPDIVLKKMRMMKKIFQSIRFNFHR